MFSTLASASSDFALMIFESRSGSTLMPVDISIQEHMQDFWGSMEKTVWRKDEKHFLVCITTINHFYRQLVVSNCNRFWDDLKTSFLRTFDFERAPANPNLLVATISGRQTTWRTGNQRITVSAWNSSRLAMHDLLETMAHTSWSEQVV